MAHATEDLSRQLEEPTAPASRLRPLWIVRDFRTADANPTEFEQARQWLNQSVEITPESLILGSQRCQTTHVQTRNLSRFELIEWLAGIDPETIGIDPQTLSFSLTQTGCRVELLKAYVRLPDRRLLLKYRKTIFILEPNVN